jgi:hypothetical protein
MKTLKALLACVFLATGAVAWAETLGNLQPLVQLSRIRRDFTGSAQVGKLLKVEGLSSTKWTAKSNVSWIKLTKASGKGGESVSYSVAENDSDDDREGEITVISNGESATFTVRQAADVFVISPARQFCSANRQPGLKLDVKSSGTNEWTSKSNQKWLVIESKGSGTGNGFIIYSVKTNNTGNSRVGQITVYKGSNKKSLSVVQKAVIDNDDYTSGWLELTSSYREFSYEAASNKEVQVRGNVRWEAETDAAWIDLRRWKGEGNGPIRYTLYANKTSTERTGVITVTGGGNTLTFTVKQAGRPTPKLTLGASSASLGATGTGGAGKTVAVEANLKWTAKSQDSWIKVTGGASGSGNGTVTYYVGLSMDPGTRSGSITVEGGGMTRSFTVHQKGPDPSLSLGAASRTFAASGGTGKELKVAGNVSWTAKSSASWLTVKKGSGKGGGTVLYNVAKNTGKEGRAAVLAVTGGGLSRTCLILQNGTGNTPVTAATLELGASERTFGADAATGRELKVTANIEWTAKSSASWLKVKTAGGSGNGTILYNVAANTDSAARTAVITVAGSGLTRTFTVKQSGKSGGGGQTATLTLGAGERSFTAAAATGKELKVTADVAWTAKSSASWLKVRTAGGSGNGTILYNVAANTGTSSRKATITVTGGGLTRTFTATQSGQGSSPKSLRRQAVLRARVTTSDGTDGAAVADGDESTAWSPSTADGSWVALTFDDARPVDAVSVLGERLPDGLRVLVSEDGDIWSEDGGDAVNYLWLLLPGEGEIPVVREIGTEP